MVGKQRRTVKKLHKRRNILKGYSKKKPHYIQKKSRRKKTSYKRKRPNKRTRGKRRKFILSGGVNPGLEDGEGGWWKRVKAFQQRFSTDDDPEQRKIESEGGLMESERAHQQQLAEEYKDLEDKAEEAAADKMRSRALDDFLPAGQAKWAASSARMRAEEAAGEGSTWWAGMWGL